MKQVELAEEEMTDLAKLQLVMAEANAQIETINAAEAVERFPQGGVGQNEVVIVDLRDPREIEREGRSPGAFHSRLVDDLRRQLLPQLKRVVVVLVRVILSHGVIVPHM